MPYGYVGRDYEKKIGLADCISEGEKGNGMKYTKLTCYLQILLIHNSELHSYATRRCSDDNVLKVKISKLKKKQFFVEEMQL